MWLVASRSRRREPKILRRVRVLGITDANALMPQGAGNVFKEGEAEQAKHASNDSAIEDKAESLAAKGKALFFGKKDKQ